MTLLEENEMLKKNVEVLERNLRLLNEAYGSHDNEIKYGIFRSIQASIQPYYHQFEDFKGEEPDMAYYDGLVNMLDEIFEILKAKGVKLN